MPCPPRAIDPSAWRASQARPCKLTRLPRRLDARYTSTSPRRILFHGLASEGARPQPPPCPRAACRPDAHVLHLSPCVRLTWMSSARSRAACKRLMALTRGPVCSLRSSVAKPVEGGRDRAGRVLLAPSTCIRRRPLGRWPHGHSPHGHSPLGSRAPAAPAPAARAPAAREPAAAQEPAARTPAARMPAARTPAARMPAARMPAARTHAARMPAARTPAAQSRTHSQ